MMLRIVLIAWLALLVEKAWAACPFCSAVAQTLRMEIKQMDVAVMASFQSSESDSVATFKVDQILKGDAHIQVGNVVQANYFGQGNSEQSFLLMGIDPPNMLWSSPLRVSKKVQGYVQQVLSLPDEDATARLKFYLEHLGDTDPIIARDVFDEFATASYSEMIALKELYDRKQLIAWIEDLSISPERRKLYMVMLGICGLREDAEVLEKMLLSDDPNMQAGLDALIACYLTLKGQDGLKIIDEKYLANTEASYHDIYAAVMSLRFHGTEGNVIDKRAVTKSLRLLLDRPKLADLVIPDLARWEDWSQVDKIVKLFKESEANEASWLRIPAIRYLKACPLPEAATALEELRELDPAAFRRAMQFFPQPAATDNSYWPERSGNRLLYGTWLAGLSIAGNSHSAVLQDKRAGTKIATIQQTAHRPESIVVAETASSAPNLIAILSVIATFGSSLWVSMWLTITGAGRQSLWLMLRTDR